MARIFFTIVLAMAALTGCTRLNEDHCGNQQGDATCQERGGEALYCSVCVSDNDGCVVEQPTRACGEGAGTEQTGSTLDATGSEVSTGSGEATVVDPSASSSNASGTTGDPPDPCGNGEVDVGEDCDGDVGEETCLSLMSGDGNVSCDPKTCRFDTSQCRMPSMCGNGELEPGEQCETEGISCSEYDPDVYIGGNAPCIDCEYETKPCIRCGSVGDGCTIDNSICCNGLECRQDVLDLSPTCKNPE